MILVDGRPACGWHLSCAVLLKEGTFYCHLYHRMVAHSVPETVQRTMVHPRFRRYTYEDCICRQDVNFKIPSPTVLSRIPCMQDIDNSDLIPWSIDWVFTTISRSQPVPWAVTIRDARTNTVIISSAVDHGQMSLVEAERRIRETP